MTDPAPTRGVIPPVPAGDPRPLWSVMIPTYNCARYLGETLMSVLAQDPGPAAMQIAVVDDCSTEDDPAAVVEATGGGRIEFVRQDRNVGHTRNFDTCLSRARGQLIHLLHGDDQVRPGFYRTLQQPFETHPQVGAAFCRWQAMDDQGQCRYTAQLERPQAGVLDGWLERIATGQRVQAPAMVVRREVYERLGGFDRRMHRYAEDWEMWVRIAAHYPVWYEVEPLAIYRVRPSSLSGQSLRTGENGADLRRAIAINATYLPPERAGAITRAALEACAQAALRRGRRALGARDPDTAVAQLREAIRFSRSLRIVAACCGLAARLGLTAFRRTIPKPAATG